ncbi:MAG: MATE family efflux transporter [Xanthomonadales bacterium]|nr:MATE family efflux transporter [Xanthomonadales bacterium]
MSQLGTHRPIQEMQRTLFLALPIIIGQVAGVGMSFVDTVMAGRLGALALAALPIGGAIWMTGVMFAIGILLALNPAVAQLDGAGKNEEVGAVTRQAVWVAIGLSALLFVFMQSAEPLVLWFGIDAEIRPVALGYLSAISWGIPAICLQLVLRYFSEGTGHTQPTMYIGFLGVAANIPLNYIFMYGKLGMPELGAIGCGYATAIVLWLQLLLLWAYTAKHPHFRRFKLYTGFEKPNWPEIRELLRVGLPIAVMISVEGSLFVAAALLIGKLGTIPTAAHGIAINFSSLLFMIPLGLAAAITTRVGNAIGRDDPVSARYVGMNGFALGFGFQIISAVIMFLFADQIVSIYGNTNPEVSQLAASLIQLAAIFQLSDGVQVCAAGGLRGLKDTKIPMIYTIIAYWAVGMTLAYHLTFTQQMGPAGMWIGMIAGLTVAAVLLGVRFWRSASRLIVESG